MHLKNYGDCELKIIIRKTCLKKSDSPYHFTKKYVLYLENYSSPRHTWTSIYVKCLTRFKISMKNKCILYF